MSDPSNVIHSAEEEKRRADAVYQNPRILAAYRQALNETSVIDKLLEIIGVPTHRLDDALQSHLGKDDAKLLDDYLSAKRDVPAQDRAKAENMKLNLEDEFFHNVTGCPKPNRSPSGGGRSI